VLDWHDAKFGFPTVFFRTSRWFAPPHVVLGVFLQQYALPARPKLHFLLNAFARWTDTARANIRRCVCLALALWARTDGALAEPRAAQILAAFIDTVRADHVCGQCQWVVVEHACVRACKLT
jgi:hypothetical protein